jgi:pimeloyl-ACP methyl ester carboxylesterase
MWSTTATKARNRRSRLRLVLLAAVCVLAAAIATGGAQASPASVTFAACGPEVLPGFECGTVDVPIDRANPAAGTIPLAFQLFPHWGTLAQPSEAVVVSFGGPGISNTAVSTLWYFRFQALLEHRDLLVIDHRGMGASAAIDCPGLQHVIGDQVVAARACGAQLGAAADRYGSGDVADDVDELRAALGIEKIDYYGDSYGAVDVRAYAYRYPARLRVAVLDSPYNSMDETFLRTLPTAAARIEALVCRRSPSCSTDNADPEGTLEWLIQRVRRQPVTGTGYDADGNPHQLRVDEQTLLGILDNDYFADPAFLNQGELTAAAAALRHNDPAPLLRLAAESPSPTDFGDPNGLFSVGSTYAVFCSDGRLAWDKSAPEATREAQYEAALAALPADATAPFSPSAWTGFVASQPILILPAANACVPWPTPTRPYPPFPENQPFPTGVPALLLGGDLDYLDINSERELLPLFPAGTPFVEVASAGHVTGAWNDCAQGIILHFMDTLQTGDTSCAADPNQPMHQPFGAATGTVQLQGVGSFPRNAQQATPAQVDPSATDRSTPTDRRVASVAWSTVEDAVYRSLRMFGDHGRGLRGGEYTVSRSDTSTTITYLGARFAEDVAVSGTATLDRTTNTLDATVDVDSVGNHDGTLTLQATLWDPSQPTAQIRGSIRGRTLALTMPTY